MPLFTEPALCKRFSPAAQPYRTQFADSVATDWHGNVSFPLTNWNRIRNALAKLFNVKPDAVRVAKNIVADLGDWDADNDSLSAIEQRILAGKPVSKASKTAEVILEGSIFDDQFDAELEIEDPVEFDKQLQAIIDLCYPGSSLRCDLKLANPFPIPAPRTQFGAGVTTDTIRVTANRYRTKDSNKPNAKTISYVTWATYDQAEYFVNLLVNPARDLSVATQVPRVPDTLVWQSCDNVRHLFGQLVREFKDETFDLTPERTLELRNCMLALAQGRALVDATTHMIYIPNLIRDNRAPATTRCQIESVYYTPIPDDIWERIGDFNISDDRSKDCRCIIERSMVMFALLDIPRLKDGLDAADGNLPPTDTTFGELSWWDFTQELLDDILPDQHMIRPEASVNPTSANNQMFAIESR